MTSLHITDFINGYCFGHAIQVQSDKEMTQSKLNELHSLNDVDSHNRSLGLDLSIFGRAYEYIYVTKKMRLDFTNQIHAILSLYMTQA